MRADPGGQAEPKPQGVGVGQDGGPAASERAILQPAAGSGFAQAIVRGELERDKRVPAPHGVYFSGIFAQHSRRPVAHHVHAHSLRKHQESECRKAVSVVSYHFFLMDSNPFCFFFHFFYRKEKKTRVERASNLFIRRDLTRLTLCLPEVRLRLTLR